MSNLLKKDLGLRTQFDIEHIKPERYKESNPLPPKNDTSPTYEPMNEYLGQQFHSYYTPPLFPLQFPSSV